MGSDHYNKILWTAGQQAFISLGSGGWMRVLASLGSGKALFLVCRRPLPRGVLRKREKASSLVGLLRRALIPSGGPTLMASAKANDSQIPAHWGQDSNVGICGDTVWPTATSFSSSADICLLLPSTSWFCLSLWGPMQSSASPSK